MKNYKESSLCVQEILTEISLPSNQETDKIYFWNDLKLQFSPLSEFQSIISSIKALKKNNVSDPTKHLNAIARSLESTPLPNPNDLISNSLLDVLLGIISHPSCEALLLLPSLKIILFLTLCDNDKSEPLYSKVLTDLLLGFIRPRPALFPLSQHSDGPGARSLSSLILSNLLAASPRAESLFLYLLSEGVVEVASQSLSISSSFIETKSILRLLRALIRSSKARQRIDLSSFSLLAERMLPFLSLQSELQSSFCDVYCDLISIRECFERALECRVPDMLSSRISAHSFACFMKLVNCFCRDGVLPTFDSPAFKNRIIALCAAADSDGLRQLADFVEKCGGFDFAKLAGEMLQVLCNGSFQKKVIACEMICRRFPDVARDARKETLFEIVVAMMEIVFDLPEEGMVMCLKAIDFYIDACPEQARKAADEAQVKLEFEQINNLGNDEVVALASNIKTKMEMMSS